MKTFLKIELCLLILGIVVGVGGIFIAMASSAHWIFFGTVPGTPVEITEQYPYFHVRTSDGQTYVCEYLDFSQGACEPNDTVVIGDVTAKGACGDPVPLMEPYPGTVVSAVRARVCTAHEGEEYDFHMVALDDGRILGARRTPWIATYPYIFGGLGGLVGLALGVPLFGISSVFRRRSQGKAKNDFKSAV